MWKTVEYIAWLTGLLCIVIWASAQAHHILASQSYIADFKQLKHNPSIRRLSSSDTREKFVSRPSLIATPLVHTSSANAPSSANAASAIKAIDVTATPNYAEWSTARIEDYRQAIGAGKKTSGNQAVGIIEIDAVNISAPVFHGIDEWSLNAGVGLIPDMATFTEGNTGIAGHRDGFFRRLKDITVGDVITITTFSEVRRYAVTARFVVKPEDTWVLEPTRKQNLTLVTCYPFYFVGSAPQRFIVRAQLITNQLHSNKFVYTGKVLHAGNTFYPIKLTNANTGDNIL